MKTKWLCEKEAFRFNVHETFRNKFKELNRTNSLLIIHANLYFQKVTNFAIVPLGKDIDETAVCKGCSCSCEWKFGTRLFPGMVYTKFMIVEKTNDVEDGLERFEAERLMRKLSNPAQNLDFPFEYESQVPPNQIRINKDLSSMVSFGLPRTS